MTEKTQEIDEAAEPHEHDTASFARHREAQRQPYRHPTVAADKRKPPPG